MDYQLEGIFVSSDLFRVTLDDRIVVKFHRYRNYVSLCDIMYATWEKYFVL